MQNMLDAAPYRLVLFFFFYFLFSNSEKHALQCKTQMFMLLSSTNPSPLYFCLSVWKNFEAFMKYSIKT